MPAASSLVAHGGVAGAFVEATLVLGILFVFGAVWIRERRARRAGDDEDAAPVDRRLLGDESEEDGRA